MCDKESCDFLSRITSIGKSQYVFELFNFVWSPVASFIKLQRRCLRCRTGLCLRQWMLPTDISFALYNYDVVIL